MIDIVYLTHNRLEFTQASMRLLIPNTDWNLVNEIWLYDDRSTDGTREYLDGLEFPVRSRIFDSCAHSPVGVMNHYLDNDHADVFAKIDNDVMLPPRWLRNSFDAMEANDSIDLLGIEAKFPTSSPGPREAVETGHIGGIGLMRARAFRYCRPCSNARFFGFTEWQDSHPHIKKAWLNPSLPVCLLDRLRFEPWRSLSQKYVDNGWQRVSGEYDENSAYLWNWWRTAA